MMVFAVHSLSNDFHAASIEQSKVCEINYGILVKVGAVAPMRFAAIRLEPVRCKMGHARKILVNYLDCVFTAKVSTVGK